MSNEIAGYGDLILIFILIILSEQILQLCNRIWHVCEKFKGPMKMLQKDNNFQW
jgi:hypothetical protein